MGSTIHISCVNPVTVPLVTINHGWLAAKITIEFFRDVISQLAMFEYLHDVPNPPESQNMYPPNPDGFHPQKLSSILSPEFPEDGFQWIPPYFMWKIPWISSGPASLGLFAGRSLHHRDGHGAHGVQSGETGPWDGCCLRRNHE